ncbi:MAG: VOC family protein [Calditrichaceae bacterium]
MLKLGMASQLSIGTKDIEKSFDFYEKLGFTKKVESSIPNPWMQISDGTLLILLNQDGPEYIGLNYFASGMESKVEELKKAGIEFLETSEDDGNLYMGSFSSPDNFTVGLINRDPNGMYRPDGYHLFNFPKKYFYEPQKYPNERCGIFGEICHPVKDLNLSMKFWETLGFEQKAYNKQPYPWAIISDGMNYIGLHQTRDFKQPAITYYAPDVPKRVKALENAGIDSVEFFGGIFGNDSNVIIKTPEGQKFFLFNL